MSLPYENATSGKAATDDIHKILRAFGASSFGIMEDFDKSELLIQFTWRERPVSIRASAKGYAAAWLKEHPWSSRMQRSRVEHERKALHVGSTAVYSILRDWIKGQVTAVETGILSFDSAFLGQIMLPSGRTVLEMVSEAKMLPTPAAA